MESSREFTGPVGPIMRAVCWLGGADPDLLALTPKSDRDALVTIVVLQCLGFVWLTASFTLAAHIVLHVDGFRLDLPFVALLPAAIIVLADAYIFNRTSHFTHGLSELRQGGLDIAVSQSSALKSGATFWFRIAIAIDINAFCAVVLALLIFQPEIATRQFQSWQKQNEVTQASARLKVEGDIVETGRLRDRLRTNSVEHAAEVVRLNDTLRDSNAPPPGFSEARTALDAVGKLRDVAEAEQAAAFKMAANEKGGVRETRENSGQSGLGPVYAAAMERAQIATERLQRLQIDYASAKRTFDAIEQQRQTSVADRRADTLARLQTLQKIDAADAVTLQALDEKHERLSSRREAAIDAAMRADTRYVAPEDGLLSRAKALRELARDPWIAGFILMLDLGILGIEMLFLLAKTSTLIPSTYARLLVNREYVGQVITARNVHAAINDDMARSTISTETIDPFASNADSLEGVVPAAEVAPATQSDSELPSAEPPATGLIERLKLGAEAARQRAAESGAASSEASTTEGGGIPLEPRRRGRPPGRRWQLPIRIHSAADRAAAVGEPLTQIPSGEAGKPDEANKDAA